jgi:hypothetical protein
MVAVFIAADADMVAGLIKAFLRRVHSSHPST